MSRQKTDRIPRQNILYDLNFENNTLPSEKDINFKSKIPFDLFYFIVFLYFFVLGQLQIMTFKL